MKQSFNSGIPLTTKARTILVRNQQDPFLDPAEGSAIAKQNNWEFLQIPGYHDDLWDEPLIFITVLKDILEKL